MQQKSESHVSLIDNFNVYYCPNFLDKRKADKYFNILENELKYNSKEESKVKIFGKEFYIPRSQVAYGDQGTHYSFAGTKVNAKSWDDKNILCTVLKNIKHKVEIFTGKKFNFVLINRYKDGNQYIGYHSDDEKELGKDPTIVGISLGAERDFMFKPRKFIPENISSNFEINLGHGSLVSMNPPTNDFWYHSVPKRAAITKPRISLTFRYINL